MKTIEIYQLTKQYKSFTALDDINLTIETNTVWGLVGPNGSGKTTLLSIIAGILTPTSGSVSLGDNKTIGAIIESPCFYHHLTGEQNLQVVARSRNTESVSIEEVLAIVRLEVHRTKRYETYSLGMKQRLGIAAALLSSPKILLLDEPTNGLDPIGIREMREIIAELVSQERSIILASHLLSEIDQICTHIALLNEGKLIFKDNRQEFLGQNSIETAFLNRIN